MAELRSKLQDRRKKIGDPEDTASQMETPKKYSLLRLATQQLVTLQKWHRKARTRTSSTPSTCHDDDTQGVAHEDSDMMQRASVDDSDSDAEHISGVRNLSVSLCGPPSHRTLERDVPDADESALSRDAFRKGCFSDRVAPVAGECHSPQLCGTIGHSTVGSLELTGADAQGADVDSNDPKGRAIEALVVGALEVRVDETLGKVANAECQPEPFAIRDGGSDVTVVVADAMDIDVPAGSPAKCNNTPSEAVAPLTTEQVDARYSVDIGLVNDARCKPVSVVLCNDGHWACRETDVVGKDSAGRDVQLWNRDRDYQDSQVLEEPCTENVGEPKPAEGVYFPFLVWSCCCAREHSAREVNYDHTHVA